MTDGLTQLYAGLGEATRLSRSMHGRLEFLRTQELLRRYLPPPPAVVLDVGGGTGVHAAWLTADGYAAHVVDPVPEHASAAVASEGVTAEVGDARRLAVPDAGVDVVLLLGPLYHLEERSHRVEALREARRVLRPGGVLFAAVISRYLSLIETGTTGRLNEVTADSITTLLSTGTYDGHVGFVPSHWHTAEDLRAEMCDAEIEPSAIVGVEGPAWPTLDALGASHFDGLCQPALRAARLVEEDANLLHASAHLLAVAVRSSDW